MKNKVSSKLKNKQPHYDPEFVAKVKASKKQIEQGHFTILDPSISIWENIR